MPIPFRDHTAHTDLGLAGYLRFVDEPDGRGLRGALFLIDALGNPVDFSFNRVELPRPFLWRTNEPRRNAIRELAKSLFAACSGQPLLLLTLAEEVPLQIFVEDLEVLIPLCRLSNAAQKSPTPAEAADMVDGQIDLAWVSGAPLPETPARQLLDALRERRLLTEPFERVAVGLEEACRAV